MMCSFITLIVATVTPLPVPDTGSPNVLLGLGILSLGIVARLLKNRKR